MFESVTTAIGTVGFPIVCCILMAWYIRDSSLRNAKTYKEYNKRYEDLAQKCIEIVQDNSVVMSELTTMIKTHIKIEDGGIKEHGEIDHNNS